MNITKSREYIECYEYVNSFYLMMKLSGYNAIKRDSKTITSSLIDILERSQRTKNLEIQEKFSIGTSSNNSLYSNATIAQLEITFYTEPETNSFEVGFRIFNNLLKELQQENIIKSDNSNNMSIFYSELSDMKELLENTISSFENI